MQLNLSYLQGFMVYIGAFSVFAFIGISLTNYIESKKTAFTLLKAGGGPWDASLKMRTRRYIILGTIYSAIIVVAFIPASIILSLFQFIN